MERLEMVELFFLLTKADSTPPSINKLAKEAKVSWRVASKVAVEYETYGTMVDQTEI